MKSKTNGEIVNFVLRMNDEMDIQQYRMNIFTFSASAS